MPSPFPGMDPYIEPSKLWGDFHGSMLAEIRAQLNSRLPQRYSATIDLYVWLHEPEARKRARTVKPDVYVSEQPRGSKRGSRAVLTAAPTTIMLPAVERHEHKHVLISDQDSNRVVTAIELLSPNNKDAGPDRDAYLLKRNEYLASRVNVVEIDLLRGGPRLPLSEPAPARSDFYVLVCRAWEFPQAALWPFTMREPFPAAPIPLSQDSAEVTLDLGQCAAQAYDKGRYTTKLKYDRPLRPRPSRTDATWIHKLLAEGQVKSS